MENLGYTTGNTIVDAIGKIHLEGNVIPHTWYQTIKHPNGKPNLVAISILADAVYWYRPTVIRDEATGHIVAYRKKFKADLLQRSYDQIADFFGITKRQATDNVVFLEKLGVLERDLRTIYINGAKHNNVLFLKLKLDGLLKVTYPGTSVNVVTTGNGESSHVTTGEGPTIERDTSHDRTGQVPRYNVTPPTLERETNTEITTEITTEISTERNTSRPKRVYDEQSTAYRLASRLYENILANNPEFKKPNLQNWANDVRLMMERDNRREDQIEYLIDWCQNNTFWKSNILSASKLREKFDQLVIRVKEDIKKQNTSTNIPRAYQSTQDWAEEEE